MIRSIVAFAAVGLCAAYVPTAMAVTPTETAVFQCNLFTAVPFNLQTFNKTTNSTITLPAGSTSTCMDLLEQLLNLGLTNVNVSYQSVSNGVNGNYMTFTLSNGTVAGL